MRPLQPRVQAALTQAPSAARLIMPCRHLGRTRGHAHRLAPPAPRRRAPAVQTPCRAATSAVASLSRTPAADQPLDLGTRSSGAGRLDRAGPRDDDRDLAADPVGGPGGQLGQPAAAYLLVGLGQLPAHRGRPVGAERLGHRGERRRGAGAAPRRRPSCAARRPASASRRARSPALRGRNPSKQNRSTGSPRHRQRGEHRGRARDGGHRDAGLDRGGHQPVAGVGDRRHPGVGDQQHPLAGLQRLDQLRGAARPRCPRSRRRPGRSTVDAEVAWSAGAAGGCPRRRPRRRPASSRPAAARRRRRRRSASPRAPARRSSRRDHPARSNRLPAVRPWPRAAADPSTGPGSARAA